MSYYIEILIVGSILSGIFGSAMAYRQHKRRMVQVEEIENLADRIGETADRIINNEEYKRSLEDPENKLSSSERKAIEAKFQKELDEN